MPREKRPPEVQKCFDHINRADRLFRKAMERFVEVDQKIGVRPGHRAEMERRIIAYRDELDNLIAILERKGAE